MGLPIDNNRLEASRRGAPSLLTTREAEGTVYPLLGTGWSLKCPAKRTIGSSEPFVGHPAPSFGNGGSPPWPPPPGEPPARPRKWGDSSYCIHPFRPFIMPLTRGIIATRQPSPATLTLALGMVGNPQPAQTEPMERSHPHAGRPAPVEIGTAVIPCKV